MSRADTHHYVQQKPPLHCLPQFDPSAIDITSADGSVDVEPLVNSQETDRELLHDFKEVFQYFQTTKDPDVRKFVDTARKLTGANEYDPSGPYAGGYKGGRHRRKFGYKGGRHRRKVRRPKRSKQQRELDAGRYRTRRQKRKQALFKFSELNEQGAKAVRAANRNFNFRMSPGKLAATLFIVAMLATAAVASANPDVWCLGEEPDVDAAVAAERARVLFGGKIDEQWLKLVEEFPEEPRGVLRESYDRALQLEQEMQDASPLGYIKIVAQIMHKAALSNAIQFGHKKEAVFLTVTGYMMHYTWPLVAGIAVLKVHKEGLRSVGRLVYLVDAYVVYSLFDYGAEYVFDNYLV